MSIDTETAGPLMSTFNLYITEMEIFDVGTLNKHLLKLSKQVYRKLPSADHSNEGYQSPRLHTDDHPVFLDLFDKTKQHILNVLKIYDLKKIGNIDFSLPWININKPGDFNWPHEHFSTHFSLIYSLKVPKKSGDIVFSNPFTQGNSFYLKEFNDHNSNNARVYKHTPRENMLILFPSNLKHAVERNRSKQDRISIAFDITVK